MPHDEIPKRLRASAKRLRKEMTTAERRLWRAIRAHRLEDIGFRRQMPVLGHIVDFAAPSHRLIIELDGSQHARHRRATHDAQRDRKLVEAGWTVLRFWNAEVLTNLGAVCDRIWVTAREIKS